MFDFLADAPVQTVVKCLCGQHDNLGIIPPSRVDGILDDRGWMRLGKHILCPTHTRRLIRWIFENNSYALQQMENDG